MVQPQMDTYVQYAEDLKKKFRVKEIKQMVLGY